MGNPTASKRLYFWVGVLLVAVTAVVFAPSLQSDFINYDDGPYVRAKPQVRAGLDAHSLWWALTTMEQANWHPLTWMSFQLDYVLHGGSAWGCHLINVVLHIANVLLLFMVLRRLTGATWRSALVAILFAVHPLHVESVAWVSERKDVLSTLFWLLTIWAYAGYVEHPSGFRYATLLVVFALGLMAKSMLVTLPFVLLLLDYWPLGRLAASGYRPSAIGFRPTADSRQPISLLAALLEKAPLLGLSAASSALTFYAQRINEGYLRAVEPLVRAEYALTAYFRYIGKTLWPVGLIPYYAYPRDPLPAWQVIGAALLLLGITGLVLKLGRRHPYLPVGWFWYLGTLAPVIGVVPIQGSHAMADRYTYVPLIGLFIMFSWGAGELVMRWQLGWRIPALASGIIVGALALSAREQVGRWRDSETLWRYTLEVDPDNFVANHNLGVLLAIEELYPQAIRLFTKAVRADPMCDHMHFALAVALGHDGQLDAAIDSYRQALRLNSKYPGAYNLLGMALELKGNFADAAGAYAKAIEQKPTLLYARENLGQVLTRQGKLAEAAEQFAAALELDPESAGAHHGLGLIQALNGQAQKAVASYRRAVELQPGVAAYHRDLAHALLALGETEAGKSQYAIASQQAPEWLGAANREAWGMATNPDATSRSGQLALYLAIELAEATGYQRPEILDTLAAAYAEVGQFDLAQATAKKALAMITGPDRAERARAVESRLHLYQARKPYRAE